MIMSPFRQHPVPAVYDVCAVGNAIVDIIAECDEAFLVSYEITKGAMNLVDETRADFLYKNLGPSIETSGGSAANTVAGVAALGGMPTYIGKVKSDEFGKIFRHDMRASGVHFPTQAATEGPSTARSLIVVTPDAQRSMNTYLGACADLCADDVDPQLVANAQVTFLEGYLFDKPKAQEAFYVAAKIAHEAGRHLALTPSDTFCVDRHRDGFMDLVKNQVDYLVANEFELMSLFQVSSFEEAMAQARTHCQIVVGTRSEKGAVIASADQTYVIEADPVAQAVDSTGAGDMFAAGFLFGLTHGYDLPTSGRIGAVVASEVIGHYGPRAQGDLKDLVRAKGINL
ncbi:MAG: adenosine kinase [Alphaproteobacteria bacterium]|nr:adenosine kinase [Alphaproteobacteria bacterium]